MPNYEFRCSKCQETFEKNVPIAERRQLQDCPECGARFSAELDPAAGAPGFKVRGGTQKFYG